MVGGRVLTGTAVALYIFHDLCNYIHGEFSSLLSIHSESQMEAKREMEMAWTIVTPYQMQVQNRVWQS
jgi:hypothetical protein